MRISYYVTAGIFAGLVTALAIVTVRASKGRCRDVREKYALKSVSLLVGLGAETIVTFSTSVTPWTILASLLGIDITQSAVVLIVNRLFSLTVFFICVIFVTRTHAQWRGEISRRQFRINAQELSDSTLLLDFAVSLASIFKQNYELNPYIKFSNTGPEETSSVDVQPWYREFAQIYSVMSNQSNISIDRDWHPQNHCFISSFADNQTIAVFCSITLPSARDLEEFFAYIHNFHQSYLYILVAVKENPDKLDDYSMVYQGENIQYLFKDNCLNHITDFTEYYHTIDELYHRPLLQGANQAIDDVYVEPNCCVGTNVEKISLHEHVRRWLENDETRQLALLGDYGQGKTLFATFLTHQMIKNHARRIPVLIPLRNKSPRNSSPIEILSYFTSRYGINPEALNILNANGRLLLIFDGFDEMDLVGNDDIRKRHFKSLWKLVTPKSKVLITGRPNYFLSPAELKSALGIHADSKDLSYCEDLYLQPFNRAQITSALRNASTSVQRGIQHIIDGGGAQSFLDLIGRPSQLFLVSQIWDERGLAHKYKNLTSATIINEFLQGCYERQSAKAESEPFFFLAPLEREYFMIGLAIKMYKLGLTAIPRELFYNTVCELIDLFPERLSVENSMFINLRNGKSVKAFTRQDKNNLEAVINDVRTCGILVNDYINDGFTFAHKSFFDFLVAKYFLGKSLKTHDATMEITSALSGSGGYNVRLKNDLVIRKLLAELISTKITLNLTKSSMRTKCRKIFDQCVRIIAHRHIRNSPQRLFVRCLKQNQNSSERIVQVVRVREEVGRLLLLMMLLPFTIIIYVSRSVYLIGYFGESAAQAYFRMESLPLAYRTSTVNEGDSFWLLAMLLFLCAVYLMMRITAYRAELVLLTWYYTCRDNGIPDRIILDQISPAYHQAFMDYMKGHSLTDIQDELTKKRHRKAYGNKSNIKKRT